jgi:hypothetical protein
MAAEQVVNAVRALYGAHNPAQQAQANAWLTAFQHSQEAWQVPLVLLAPEQPEDVQFFAATVLVRKVRTEWSKLDADSRQSLQQAIRCVLPPFTTLIQCLFVVPWMASSQKAHSYAILK